MSLATQVSSLTHNQKLGIVNGTADGALASFIIIHAALKRSVRVY